MAPSMKRRKLDTEVVEEITFDPDARQEFLTGFHKRKLERAKHARETAEKKARAEKIEERRRLREGRKIELERHLEEVNALLQPQGTGNETTGTSDNDDDDDDEEDGGYQEWNGFQEPPPVNHEAEYIDEDRFTTVTVEEMDVSKEGIHKADQRALASSKSEQAVENPDTVLDVEAKKPMKRVWTKERPKNATQRPKQKKKKFRYESKAERKMTRFKQKSKNSRQAKARRET